MSIYFTLLQSQCNSLINPRLWRRRNISIPFIKILQCPLHDSYHLIRFGKVISLKYSWKRINWIRRSEVAKCLAFLCSEIPDPSWLSQVPQECLSLIVDLTNLITSLPFFHLRPPVLPGSRVHANLWGRTHTHTPPSIKLLGKCRCKCIYIPLLWMLFEQFNVLHSYLKRRWE